MISIDRFEEILSDLAEEIPQSFYEELNGGIVVEPGYLLHPEDRSGTLYVMGQYRIDPAMGKYIVMYYGSFKRAYRHLDEDELTEEMRKVLRHEFRHHVEGRAGVRDLEVWDAEQIAMYKNSRQITSKRKPPERNLSFGWFLVILEQQKAFVLEPLNYAFERFLIRSADGVQVDAAGQVGQRPGAGLLNLLVKRVGVIPRENMQRCTDLTVYSVLDRHINHGSAEIDDRV